MTKKKSAGKRALIAAVLISFLLISALVSVIIVLAAQTQNVSSRLSVNYVVDGVGVKASAKYYLVNSSSGEVAKTVTLMTSDSSDELEFGVGDPATKETLQPDESEIKLTSATSRIVYEYKFTNTAEVVLSIACQNTTQPENMTLSYKSSPTQITTFGTFSDTTLKNQILIDVGDSVYLYFSLQVADLGQGANYSGELLWNLSALNATLSTLSLNNDGGTGGQTEVEFYANANYQLPHLKSVPTKGDLIFKGYKNASGTLAYDEFGVSTSYSGTANETLTAVWEDSSPVVVENGVVTGLTTAGQALETLDIPDTVTEIGANSLKNASAKTINIPSSVTKIGDSAFEGNTAVETVNFGGGAEAQAHAWGGGTAVRHQHAYNHWFKCL